MKSLLRWAFFLPFALLVLYFAMANCGPVTISLDPFHTGGLARYTFKAPLFLVVMTGMAVGVVFAGVSCWMTNRGVRRSARLARAEAARAQTEIEKLREQALANLPSANAPKRLVE